MGSVDYDNLFSYYSNLIDLHVSKLSCNATSQTSISYLKKKMVDPGYVVGGTALMLFACVLVFIRMMSCCRRKNDRRFLGVVTWVFGIGCFIGAVVANSLPWGIRNAFNWSMVLYAMFTVLTLFGMEVFIPDQTEAFFWLPLVLVGTTVWMGYLIAGIQANANPVDFYNTTTTNSTGTYAVWSFTPMQVALIPVLNNVYAWSIFGMLAAWFFCFWVKAPLKQHLYFLGCVFCFATGAWTIFLTMMIHDTYGQSFGTINLFYIYSLMFMCTLGLFYCLIGLQIFVIRRWFVPDENEFAGFLELLPVKSGASMPFSLKTVRDGYMQVRNAVTPWRRQ